MTFWESVLAHALGVVIVATLALATYGAYQLLIRGRR